MNIKRCGEAWQAAEGWAGRAVLALLALGCAAEQPPMLTSGGTRYELYFLGGQSNMEGYGRVRDLSASLGMTDARVLIFHGNPAPDETSDGGLGRWTPLRPGHGAGFSSDGLTNVYSERFGLELTFAQRMRELRPGVRIALIKYARGGTSIDPLAGGQAGSWDPDFRGGQGINQYDHFLITVQNALANTDIDGDGATDQLVPAGILWMQGETDGNHAEAAARYGASLERLIRHFRVVFRSDDLPVVIGRISDSGRDDDGRVWDYGDLVRAAQAAFVAADGNAVLVTSTDSYGYSDPWHYDSQGYLDLGRRFADAVDPLVRR
jgi:hypothetical protein